MIRILLLLTLIFSIQKITGGHHFEKGSYQIPLREAGRLFLIEASVDGQKGNFIFDTGATKLVLNKTYFRDYIKLEQTAAGISGSSASVGSGKIKILEFGGIEMRNLPVDIAPLGSIETRRGIRILGLIGMDILKDFEILIDTRSQQLDLFELDRKGNRIDPEPISFKSDLASRLFTRNDIVFIRGSIGGHSLDFCLDTGAESNVLCSSCRKNVLTTVSIKRRTTLAGIGGEPIEVLFGSMQDFELGSHQFEPMQAIITSLAALSEAYDFPVDGVLGYDFFDKGKIRINLVKNELEIQFYNNLNQ